MPRHGGRGGPLSATAKGGFGWNSYAEALGEAREGRIRMSSSSAIYRGDPVTTAASRSYRFDIKIRDNGSHPADVVQFSEYGIWCWLSPSEGTLGGHWFFPWSVIAHIRDFDPPKESCDAQPIT